MSSIVQNPKIKSFETRQFINGKVCPFLFSSNRKSRLTSTKFVEASDGGKFDLISPTTGQKFAEGNAPSQPRNRLECALEKV